MKVMLMDQLDFFSSGPIRSGEIAAAIRPYIDAILPSFNLSPRHISISPLYEKYGQPGEKVIGRSIYFSISPSALVPDSDMANDSRNGVICRLKDQVRLTYLEFPSDQAKNYSSLGEITNIGASSGCFRINLNSVPDIAALASAICADIKDLLLQFPSDFGCCDLYEQCSEVGRCIIKNQDLSAGCYYKKNLIRGNAIYKNTDGGAPHDSAAISDQTL